MPVSYTHLFVLPEAFASIILALTTGTIALIGATAMAGYIGGGGIGNIALTYGYQTFNFPLMFSTVFILICLLYTSTLYMVGFSLIIGSVVGFLLSPPCG